MRFVLAFRRAEFRIGRGEILVSRPQHDFRRHLISAPAGELIGKKRFGIVKPSGVDFQFQTRDADTGTDIGNDRPTQVKIVEAGRDSGNCLDPAVDIASDGDQIEWGIPANL